MRILITILVFVLAGWLWQKRNQELKADELRIQLIDVRSQAVQSKAIAEGRLSNKLTERYYYAQLGWIRQKTDAVSSTLSAKPPDPKMADEASVLTEITQRLGAVEQSLVASADPEILASVTKTLIDLISRLNAVERRLLGG